MPADVEQQRQKEAALLSHAIISVVKDGQGEILNLEKGSALHRHLQISLKVSGK